MIERKTIAYIKKVLLPGLGFACALGVLGACRENDAEGPRIGSRLPSLLAEARMHNAPVGAPAPREGWVVYFFSPKSPASEENSARVEALARSLPAGWGFLAVSTKDEGSVSFLDRLRVTVPVVTLVPPETLAAYQVATVPRTYLLDPGWKLHEVLDGVYRGEVADRLETRLGVTLVPSPAGTTGATPSPPGVCLDREQDPYSRGARADVFGEAFQCGSGSLWIPAS